jgi:hypothetical protein
MTQSCYNCVLNSGKKPGKINNWVDIYLILFFATSQGVWYRRVSQTKVLEMGKIQGEQRGS